MSEDLDKPNAVENLPTITQSILKHHSGVEFIQPISKTPLFVDSSILFSDENAEKLAKIIADNPPKIDESLLPERVMPVEVQEGSDRTDA
jgi:hypothetical protein